MGLSVSEPPNPACAEPVGLYVHIPFCRSKCPYCGFYSEPIRGHDPGRWARALHRELDRWQGVDSIRTAYLGGGSPTALPPDLLVALAARISALWPGLEEFTVECNPGQTSQDLLDRLRAAGADRISIGAQSLDPLDLRRLGRGHEVGDTARAVARARAAGFQNIGLDLIFAIPRSTLESWRSSLEAAVDLGVQHVSAYSLSFEEGTPLDRARRSGEVQPMDEQTDREMYELAIRTLEQAGFRHYEISNFARPGFACRHNVGTWLNRPCIGVGPAAASWWRGCRTVNVADIREYVAAVERGEDPCAEREAPNAADRACETAVLALRMRDGIELARFTRQTGLDALEVFAEPIRNHRSLGLIEFDEQRVRLTREALPIADSVLCDFACLDPASSCAG